MLGHPVRPETACSWTLCAIYLKFLVVKVCTAGPKHRSGALQDHRRSPRDGDARIYSCKKNHGEERNWKYINPFERRGTSVGTELFSENILQFITRNSSC